MEPLDLWTSGLPEHLRAHGPRVEQRDGVSCILVEDAVVRRLPAPAKAAGPADRAEEKTFMPGASDPAGRLRDLDTDGVWGEVIYPNLAFFCCFHIRSPELQIETAHLYNDWVAERFIAASDRFAPVAVLPVNDVAAAVKELWRAAKRGFRGAMLPAHVDLRPYNDPAYEPLWAVAEELGVPLTFHAGTARSPSSTIPSGSRTYRSPATAASCGARTTRTRRARGRTRRRCWRASSRACPRARSTAS